MFSKTRTSARDEGAPQEQRKHTVLQYENGRDVQVRRVSFPTLINILSRTSPQHKPKVLGTEKNPSKDA